MAVFNVHEAKTHFSALVASAQQGEDVVIAKAGTPVLRLVPLERPSPRQFGGLSFDVPDDFDAPLPEHELAAWE